MKLKTQTMICEENNFAYPPDKTHKQGDEFEVEEGHVEVLTLARKAKLKSKQKPAAAQPANQKEEKELTAGADYKHRAILHASNSKRVAAN